MDISSIIGVVSGVGFILGTIMLGGSLWGFINIPSVFVVLGGTMAAAMIAFPLAQFLSVFKTTVKIFRFKIQPPEEIIANLVQISIKARKGGLLSIESEIQNTGDPYLAQALQMTVDGTATADIAAIMQKQMALQKKNLDIGSDLFEKMGVFAPAFGMIGTLIGLVQMLATLDDPESIGPKMAVALITTFYGAVLANLFLIPMAEKISRRNYEEMTNMNIIFEGIISLRKGEHPQLMEDKLKIYLAGSKDKKAAKD